METKGLLDGVKVLDLTRVLAGPYCGMMLADMGAEVIKIEMPGRGDDSRRNAPIGNGESAYFVKLNRNKRGMTLNLKSEEGKEIFRGLVKQSDIVLENYRPGVMEKLGLGYEELRKINPAIIYGAVSGFGHYGPYSKRPGYDILGQAMSGLMSTTGWPDSAPTRTGTAISDVMGGISCCVGVLAAYVNRLKTGEGEKVDVSLVDSMVSSLEIINMIYLCTGRVPTRIGNRYEAIYPELEDEMYATNVDRVKNHEPLKALIETWTKDKTIDEIVEILLDAGVPSAPINTIDRVAKDPHIAGAREMFVDLEHPVAGKMKVTGNQLKFTNRPVHIDKPAPTLGQHTEEILKEKLGIDHESYLKLVEDKAL